MTVYLVLIMLILFLGLGLKPGFSLQRRKIFLFFSFLLMVILSGFRAYSVGSDTRQYIATFNYIDSINFSSSRFEKGFLFYVKLLRRISDNPSILLVMSSIICVGTTCRFIYRFSEDPLLSILLYIVLKAFFFQMTGMRQALGTAFVMMAFSQILEEKTIKKTIISVILVLIAIQFHYMAIVAFVPLLMWHFPNLRDNERINASSVLKWTIIISITVFVFYAAVMNIVGVVAPQYVNYFFGIYGDANYFASLFNMLIQLSFLLVGCVYLRKNDITVIERFSLIMVSLSVVIGTLAMRMEIWGRLTGVFSIYTGILLAPAVCARIDDYKNRIFLKSCIFLLSFAYMIVTFIFRPEWDSVTPYLFK